MVEDPATDRPVSHARRLWVWRALLAIALVHVGLLVADIRDGNSGVLIAGRLFLVLGTVVCALAVRDHTRGRPAAR